MIETDWENSDCYDGWFHHFAITGQDLDYTEETCELCGHQAWFKTIDGKSNNDIYLAFHLRQCLPKYHPLWAREYDYIT
jgi:hypothetical protein